MLAFTRDFLYGDEITSATELNRQPGRVLDRASERPVTITRNNEHFALLRRENMTALVKAATQTKILFEVINVAYRLRLGEHFGSEHPYGWLNVFDQEDLSQFIEEISKAFRQGSETDDWDAIAAVIHEWHESALAIQSPEIAAAFEDESDEVLLTPPSPDIDWEQVA